MDAGGPRRQRRYHSAVTSERRKTPGGEAPRVVEAHGTIQPGPVSGGKPVARAGPGEVVSGCQAFRGTHERPASQR